MSMDPVHPELLWVVIVSGIVCTILAISIGSNDVANSFSTSVGSGTLSLRGAISIAFIFEVIGSITLGGRVSDSIRNRVLNFDAFSDTPYELALGMLCSSIGATAWLIFATFFGIPVSTTHSIIGALAGFGVASGRFDGVRWMQLLYIILSWFLVPVVSIVVTATLYILLQEVVLKRGNSYKIMKNFHWVFLALFSIPLSVFIAFENSLLRSTSGTFADSYRKWFNESHWNKGISVFVVIMVLLMISSIVTYSICHFRMKSGWSFLKSYHNIDALFIGGKAKDTVLVQREREKSEEEKQEEPFEEIKKDNSDLIVTNLNSQNTVILNKSEDGSDFRLNIDRTGSMDINIGEDRVELKDSPRGSREPSDLSNSSINYDEEAGMDTNTHHFGSKFNRLMSNIKTSYNLSITKITSINRSSGSSGNGPGDLSRDGSTHRKNAKKSKRTKKRQKAISSLTALKNMSPEKRKEMNDTQTIFSAMQIVGATISIISHSANDTANAVSTFATVYFLYFHGLEHTSKNTPWYVLFCGGIAMALGLALFGYKVIKTVGMNITRVTPSRGYTIDSTAGGIVLVLSHLGIPLSSTHVTVSAILGVGMIQHVPPCLNPNLKHFRDNSFDLDNVDQGSNEDSGSEENCRENSGLESASNSNEDCINNSDSSYPNSPSAENSGDQAHANLDAMESQQKPQTRRRFMIKERFTTEYVNLKLYRRIFLTWIITIFSSGFVTAIFFLIAKAIYNAKR
ncbi:uncharacterized protein TOT_020000489 [Theileria orientalis strain Shintoku]|uniref:Phosphate transporter n=1 Tax=Theileria orientalis strain Shintoku TaxID=869250 RepID=J4C861_THEOR|nr:uncharacterized protein TOT_020000489 [Theileria orientalis strain Shintoku]BAM40228.1 uncharacterized protein TOT_020000489 [Theileria orientalis strain Shintoku]|eukprot:XP_009690529.1 uncharacterized protein TOT_020000489 [Theileria orientalis strain Shintoku]